MTKVTFCFLAGIGAITIVLLILVGFNIHQSKQTQEKNETNLISSHDSTLPLNLTAYSYKRLKEITHPDNSDYILQTDVSILENDQEVAQFSTAIMFSDIIFLAGNDTSVYFTIRHDGLGGAYLYTPTFNLYRLDRNSHIVVPVLDSVDGGLGISQDALLVIYETGDSGIFRLRSLAGDRVETFTVPEIKGAQIGNMSFSPDNKKVAIPAAFGPEQGRGEVYVLDLETKKYTREVSKPDTVFNISGWGNDGKLHFSGSGFGKTILY